MVLLSHAFDVTLAFLLLFSFFILKVILLSSFLFFQKITIIKEVKMFALLIPQPKQGQRSNGRSPQYSLYV